jgi:photosystem II stability/assembly factor-like uncharacterized protein
MNNQSRNFLFTMLSLAVLTAEAMAYQASVCSQMDFAGPQGGWVITTAIDPRIGTAYVGFHGGGILRSEDRARSWLRSDARLPVRTVTALVVDPQTPGGLYAATEEGIYYSADRGINWSARNDGLDYLAIWSLTVDSRNPTTLYAGSSGSGLFKSRDGGRHWIHLGNKDDKAVVISVVAKANTVLAGTVGSGVLRSADAGATWSISFPAPHVRKVFSVASDPDSNIVYAGTEGGLFRSDDVGARWEPLNLGQKSIVFAVAVLDHGQTILAGTGEGVLKSTDRGKSWGGVTNRENGPIVWSLAAEGAKSKHLFAGTLGNGLVISSDGGHKWEAASQSLSYQLVYAVGIVSTTTPIIYVGTAGAGVHVSKDGGHTWQPRNQGLADRIIKALAIDPRNSQILYAGGQAQYLVSGGGIFKSMNGGETWSTVASGNYRIYSFAIDPSDSRIIYAGADNGIVLATSDAGAKWAELSLGFTDPSETATSKTQQSMHPHAVFAVAVSSKNSNVIYAGTDAGVFKTQDRGLSWSDVSQGLTDKRIRSLVIDSTDPSVLYAGTGDDITPGAVFKTMDAGDHWSITSLVNQWILSLAAGNGSGEVYAGTDRGLQRSTDHADNWTNIANSDRSHYILSLALGSDGRIYAGTEGNGMFMEDCTDTTKALAVGVR